MSDRMPFSWPRIDANTAILAGLVLGAGLLVGSLAWQTTCLVLMIVVSVWLGMCHQDWGLGLLALTLPMQTYFEVGIQTGSVTLSN